MREFNTTEPTVVTALVVGILVGQLNSLLLSTVHSAAVAVLVGLGGLILGYTLGAGDRILAAVRRVLASCVRRLALALTRPGERLAAVAQQLESPRARGAQPVSVGGTQTAAARSELEVPFLGADAGTGG